jgi:hypothetical protein
MIGELVFSLVSTTVRGCYLSGKRSNRLSYSPALTR